MAPRPVTAGGRGEFARRSHDWRAQPEALDHAPTLSPARGSHHRRPRLGRRGSDRARGSLDCCRFAGRAPPRPSRGGDGGGTPAVAAAVSQLTQPAPAPFRPLTTDIKDAQLRGRFDLNALPETRIRIRVSARATSSPGLSDTCGQSRVGSPRFALSAAEPPPQKLTVLDSEIKLASLIGSMKEAFKLLRSASVTPRATEQAPQTKTGTFPLTTFSISSGRGGKPTP